MEISNLHTLSKKKKKDTETKTCVTKHKWS